MKKAKRSRRQNGAYGPDFACENCGAVNYGPYRRGLCKRCYGRQYCRTRRGFKPVIKEAKRIRFFHRNKEEKHDGR